jgi:hypothetical protein
MRRTAPRGYCGCGLSLAGVPVGHRLHRPHCDRYRVPGWRPRPEPPEHAACRGRTDAERAAVVRAEYRRFHGGVWPVEPVGVVDSTGVGHG